MFRRITSAFLVFCIVFMSIGYSSAEGNMISSDTIITENNVHEILEYLGVDSKGFEFKNVEEVQNHTVGDLEKSIKKIQKLPKEITLSENTLDNDNEVPFNEINTVSPQNRGSVVLERTARGGSYDVLFRVIGQHYGNRWSGVGNISATPINSDPGTSHKIKSLRNLSATYNSTRIYLRGSVMVDIYIGVGDLGFIKLSSQKVTINYNWNVFDHVTGGGGTR